MRRTPLRTPTEGRQLLKYVLSLPVFCNVLRHLKRNNKNTTIQNLKQQVPLAPVAGVNCDCNINASISKAASGALLFHLLRHLDDSILQTAGTRHLNKFINACGFCKNIHVSEYKVNFVCFPEWGRLISCAWWERYGCSSFLLSHLPESFCLLVG